MLEETPPRYKTSNAFHLKALQRKNHSSGQRRVQIHARIECGCCPEPVLRSFVYSGSKLGARRQRAQADVSGMRVSRDRIAPPAVAAAAVSCFRLLLAV